MTLGEKIYHLRMTKNISQEKLASLLKISRQSISKWESDESVPQIEKILELSKIFSISTDDLIDPEVSLNIEPKAKSGHKYFGTDGFRGESNSILTSDHAYKVGRFLGWYFSKLKKDGERARIVIARALLKNSPIIIFDETFSAIAEKDANKMIKNIFKKFANKTIVLISHFKPNYKFDLEVIGDYNE